MQDEPDGGLCFSYKMSLKEGFRMLGIDHQRAIRRKTEPGTDPGISGRQWRSAVPGPQPKGVVRVGKPDLAAAQLWPPPTRRQRTGAALREQDDRVEPGPRGTSDSALPARRGSEAAKLSAASVFESLHPRRHRATGATGRGSRKPQRSGHTKDTAAGVA